MMPMSMPIMQQQKPKLDAVRQALAGGPEDEPAQDKPLDMEAAMEAQKQAIAQAAVDLKRRSEQYQSKVAEENSNER